MRTHCNQESIKLLNHSRLYWDGGKGGFRVRPCP